MLSDSENVQQPVIHKKRRRFAIPLFFIFFFGL